MIFQTSKVLLSKSRHLFWGWRKVYLRNSLDNFCNSNLSFSNAVGKDRELRFTIYFAKKSRERKVLTIEPSDHFTPRLYLMDNQTRYTWWTGWFYLEFCRQTVTLIFKFFVNFAAFSNILLETFVPSLVFLTRPTLQIMGKTQTGISDYQISGQSLIKRNCHNSWTSDDIDIKFG